VKTGDQSIGFSLLYVRKVLGRRVRSLPVGCPKKVYRKKTQQRCLSCVSGAVEAVLIREKRTKGYFVAFGYSEDALHEIDAFFRREHKSIVAFTVQEILEGEIARKLA